MMRVYARTPLRGSVAFVLGLLLAGSASAQTTYVWNNAAGGSWSNGSDWNGGTVASGSSTIASTADFSQLTLGANATVTLDGNQSIGGLIFGDLGNAHNWTISAGSPSNSTLTLVGPTTPTINVVNGNATLAVILAGTQGFTMSGGGSLTLSAANSYSGTTSVAGGTLLVSGSLHGGSGTALTFLGTGGFTVSEAAGVSQGMGTLTFSAGEGTVTSTYGGSGATSLTFSSLAARAAGATGNFVLSGGAAGNPGTNNIAISGQAAGILSPGLFFGGSNYAYYDASGFVRGINYGLDANSILVGAGATIGAVNFSLPLSDVKTTGIITSQTNVTVNTLNIGGNNFTALGTVSTNSLLVSGGTNVAFSGTLRSATPGGELIVRVDKSTDQLNILTPIVNNTSASSLTKSGAGTLIANAANTFSGPLTINGGVFATNTLNTPGGAQGVGESNSLILNGGTFQYTGGGFGTWSPTITVGSAGGTINLTGGLIMFGGTFAGTGTLNVINSTNTSSAWIYMTSVSPNFAGNIVIGNGIGTQSGIQYRSTGANPFGTATITINTGGLLTDDGGNGGIVPNNIILNGGVMGTQSANMTYSGNITLQASSSIGSPPTGNSTSGTFTISGPISGGSTFSLTKNTADTAILTGANTYSGATIINQGQLTLQTGSLGNTAVSVANSTNAATLLVSGNYSIGTPISGKGSLSVGGNIGVGTVAFLNTETAPSTLTINNSATNNAIILGGAGLTTALNLNAGNSGLDQIVTGGKLVVNGSVTINLSALSGTTLPTGAYKLISFAPSTVYPFSDFTIGTTLAGNPGAIYLSQTSTALVLNVVTAPAAVYWTGSQSSVWNTNIGVGPTNFVTTPGGSTDSGVPGGATNVFFTANTASNLTTTLGQGFVINSLNFTGTGTPATSPISIGGLSLQINATSANGNVAGNGISLAAGAGAVTIAAPILLGGSQTWANNSTNSLTVSGSVTGTGSLTTQANSTGSITISGAALNTVGAIVNNGTGTNTTVINSAIGSNVTTVTQNSGASGLTLGGANSYSGGTFLTAGVLNINNSAAIGTGPLTIANNTTINNSTGGAIALSNNNTQTWGGNFTFTGTQPLNLGTGAVTMLNNVTINVPTTTAANALTVGGVIGGAFSLTVTGTGTVVANGVNTFTGPLTINNGVFSTNNVQGVGTNPQLNLNGGTFQYTGSDYPTWNPNVTIGSAGGTFDTPGGGIYFGGTFTGSGTLTIINSANTSYGWMLVTSNNPNFTGNIVIGNGIGNQSGLQYAAYPAVANPFGSGTITINNGGLLTADGADGPVPNNIVLNGGILGTEYANVTYSGHITLQASSSIGSPPTDNGTYGNITITGPISGGSAFSLTKTTADTAILAGTNTYAGATIISGGILQIGNYSAGLNGGNLGLGPVTNNASLVFDTGTSVNVPSQISGTGSLTVLDGTTVVLQGANTYTGATIISFGTLQLGTLSGASVGKLSPATTITLGTAQGNLAGNVILGDASNPANLTVTNVTTIGYGPNGFVGGNAAVSTLTFNITGSLNYGTPSGALGGGGTFENNLALTKTGPGILTLSNSGNTYTGGTNIQAGTLQLGIFFAFPDNTAVTLGSGSSSGTFDLDGQSITVSSLSTSGTGTSNIIGNSSTGAPSGLTYAGGISTFGGSIVDVIGAGTQMTSLTVNSGTLILTGANTFTGGTTISGGTLQIGNGGTTGSLTGAVIDNSNLAFNLSGYAIFAPSGGISGSGTLTQMGPGILTLPASTFGGTIAVTGGTLRLQSGSVASGASATVSSGATLSIFGLSPSSSSLTLSTLALSNSAVLGFELAGSNPTNAALHISVSNGLTLTGTTTINLSNTLAQSAGLIPLISYSGATITSGFVIGALPVGNFNATLQYNPGLIELNLTSGGGLLTWTGAISSVWDTTTANWQVNSSATTFAQGKGVIFDNTASGSGAVSVTLGAGTTVTPSSIDFANTSTRPYTVSGTGAIGGATGLTISGGGAVSLNNANTYSGATLLSSGQLNINNASAIGTGQLIIRAGTTIDNTSASAITLGTNNTQLWTGSFTFGGSNPLNLGTGVVGLTSSISLTANGANALTVGGVISDGSGGYGLTLNGAGTVSLAGANTYSGGANLVSGQLNINSGGALGLGTLTISGGTISNTSGAAVTVANNNAVNWNGNFTFGGNNPLNLGAGPVTLGKNVTVTVNGTSPLTVAAPVGDGGQGFGVTLAGTGSLILSGANTYTGATTVNGGALTLSGTTTTSGVNLAGGTLNVNGPNVLGTGTLTVSAGTLDNTSGAAVSAANAISIGGSGFTFAGSNPLTLTGVGTLTASNPTIVVTSTTNSLTLSGAIGGGSGFGLTAAGPGNLVLAGANTFSGPVTITGGTLTATNLAAGPPTTTAQSIGMSGKLNLNGGTFQSTAIGGSNSGPNFAPTITIGNNGGTWDYDAAGSLFFGYFDTTALAFVGGFAGSGTLTIINSNVANTNGYIVFEGNSPTFTGNIVIGQATGGIAGIQYSSNATQPFGTGTITVNATGVLTADTGATAPGIISNAIISNGGTIGTQGGSVTYAGQITLNSGTTTTFGSPGGGSTAGIITVSGNIVGAGGLTKLTSDTLVFLGANTYTGTTLIGGGTLQVGNGGAAGALSAGPITDNATLTFNLSSAFNLTNSVSGTGGLTKTGSGTVTLTGPMTYTGTTTVTNGTLSLTGPLASSAVTVGNSSTPATLLINGSQTIGTSAATLTVGTSTGLGNVAFAHTETTLSTLTITSTPGATAITLGNSTAFAAALTLNTSNTGTDQINTLGNLVVNSFGAVINLTPLAGTTLANGTYNLINFGTSTVPLGIVLGANTPGNNQIYYLTSTATAEVLHVISTTYSGAAYWTGSQGSLWNTNATGGTSNFVTTAGGGTDSGVPGGVTNVFFAANGAANLFTTLGQGFTINSLNFTGAPVAAGVTIAGAAALTINAGSANGNPVGSGITSAAGTGAVLISAPVLLGASQTWSNSSVNSLTLTGGVGGTGNLTLQANFTGGITLSTGIVNNIGTITNAGSGAGSTTISSIIGANVTGLIQNSATSSLTLSGVNSYTGGTTLMAGALFVSSDGNLGAATNGLTFNGGTLAVTASFSSARPVTMTGSGTFDVAGANVLTMTGAFTGAGTLNLVDVGTLVLAPTGSNSFGATNVQSGTLQLGSAGALPVAVALTLGSGLNSGGTLDLNGLTATLASLATGNSGSPSVNVIGNSSTSAAGTLIFAGGTSTFGGTIQNVIGGGNQTVSLSVSAGTLILTGTSAYTGGTIVSGTLQLGNGSAAGSIVGTGISGTGTLIVAEPAASAYTLAGPNTFGSSSGAVSVVSGTLRMQAGSVGSAATVSVNDGATLSTFGLTPTSSSLVVSALTLGNTGGAILQFELNGADPTNAALKVSTSNGMVVHGTALINIVNSGIQTTGEIPLIAYSGTPITSGFALAPSGLPSSRAVATIDYSTPGLIQLNVTSTQSIKWSGAVNTVWDVGAAINSGGTFNWTVGGIATNFVTKDAVVFDDTASTGGGAGPVAVNLPSGTSVMPSTVNFTNTNRTYTVSGTGQIAGAARLFINGGGTVTLATANTYSGGTVLNSGQLNINVGATGSVSSGIGTGPLTIGAGTLSNTSGSPVNLLGTNNPEFWNGSFTFAGNNQLSLGSGAVTLGASLTLTDNGAGALILLGSVGDGGHGYGLTVAGSGTGGVIFNIGSTYSGPTVVSGGALTLNGPISSSSVTLNGGTLNIGGANVVGAGALTINGGVIDNTSGSPITALAASNPVTIGGSFTFVGSNALNFGSQTVTLTTGPTISVTSPTNALTIGGAVTDNGHGYGITKAGPGTLILAGVNSLTGPINVTGGKLVAQTLTPNGSSIGSGAVTLSNGATLGIYASSTGISGFSQFAPVNQSGTYSTPASQAIVNNVLTLTDGHGSQARTAFLSTQLSTSSSFTATYLWTPSAAPNATRIPADGMTFMIQSMGPTALGYSGGSLGYQGISPAAAFEANIYGTPGFGFDSVGSIGPFTPFANFAFGNSYLMSVSYNASTTTLSATMAPGSGGTPVFLGSATADLAALLGPTAYIGFSGAAGGAVSIQTITNFSINGGGTLYYSNPVTVLPNASATIAVTPQFSGQASGFNNLTLGSGSTLNVVADSTAPSNAGFSLNIGSVTLNGANTINVSSNGTGIVVATLATVADGSPVGSLTIGGSGAVALPGANTYSGGTTLAGGSVYINNASAIGTGSFTINGGTIDNTSGAPITLSTNNTQFWNGSFTFGGSGFLDLGTSNVTLGAGLTLTLNGSNPANAFSVDGVIGDGGHNYGLTVAGTGTLNLNGLNTYGGATTINGGTVNVAASAQLGSGDLIVNSTLNLNNATQTVGNLSGLTTGAINLVGTALTVKQTTAQTYAGSMAGSGTLNFSAASTARLTMAGLSTYSGGTNLLGGGVLASASPFSLGSGPIVMSNKSTFSVAGGGGSAPSLTGFQGFITNQAGTFQSTAIVNNVLTLTDDLPSGQQARSAWAPIQFPTTTAFTVSFVYTPYTANAGGRGLADGMTFTIQNASTGTATLAGAGGDLGYYGVTPSVSFQINTYSGNTPGYSFNTNGSVGPNTPFSWANGTSYTITLNYIPAGTLTGTISGGGTTAQISDTVNILSVIGGPLAYFGFTGGDGGATSSQQISNFSLTAGVPAYTNPLTIVNAATATILVSNTTANPSAISNMTTLSIGNGSTLITGPDLVNVPVNQPYGLSFITSVTLNGPVTVNVGNNGTGVGTVTFTNVADGTGSGSITKTGPGVLILAGTSSYTGSTTLSGGTLQFNSTASIPPSLTTINVPIGTVAAFGYAFGKSDLARITPTSAGAVALAANSSNNLDFSSAGANLATVSLGASVGAFTFSGTLTPNGNVYRLGGGDGVLTVATSLPNVNGTTQLVINGNGTSTPESSVAGGVATGTVALTAPSTYSGGTTILDGTLNVNSDSALGAAAGVVNLTGGALQFVASGGVTLSSSRGIVLGGGAFDTNGGSDTINSVISGTNFIKIGAGDLALTNVNTYTGSTTVNGGGLVVGSTGTISSGPLVVNNTNAAPSATDVYLYNTAGQTVGTLSGNLSGSSSGNTAGIFLSTGVTLTVNQTAPGTFQGTIFGSGNLVLGASSTSTLTLTGNSTYTGSTAINGGTIQLGVANALPPTTSLTLGAGGTLNLNSNNQTIAALNSSAGNINTGAGTGGILTIGNTAGGAVTYSGVISGTGGLTWGIVNTNVANPTPSTLLLTNKSTNTGPMTINTGTLSIGVAYALSGGVAPVLPYSAAATYPGAFTLGPTATLLTNGFNLTIGSLGGGGPIGGNINLGNNSSSTLYIVQSLVQSASTGYAGVISGTGNVYIVNGVNLAVYGNWTLTGGVTHDVTTLGANHNDSPQSYLPFATSGSAVTTQGIEFAGFTDQVSTIYGGSAGDNNGKGTFVDAMGDAGKLVLSYYAASVANGGPANGSGGTQNFSGFFANDVGLIFDAGYFGNAQQLTLSGPNNTTGALTIGFTNQTTPQNGAATGAQSGVMNQVIISATSTFGTVTVGNLAVSNLVNNLTVQPTGNLTAASVTIGDAFPGSTGNNSVNVGGTLTTGSVSIGNTNLYGTNVLTILSTGTVKASGAITIGNDFAAVTSTSGTLNVNGALGTTSAPVTSLSVQAGGVLAGYGTINTASNPINVTNGTIRGGFDDGVNQLGTLSIVASSGTTAKPVLTIQGSGSSGLGQTGALMTEVLATSSTAATNSKINITGANNALSLNTASGGGSGQINIVLYDPTASLTPGGPGGATYTFVLATLATAGRIQLGGANQPAGTLLDNGATLGAGSGTMGNADLYIVGASQTYMNSVTTWSLSVDTTGRQLVLNVTSATPEPEHILLMCVGVLLAGFAIRRRWRRMGSAASVA